MGRFFHGGFRRGNVFHPRSGQQLGQRGLGGLNFRPAQRHIATEVGGIQQRDKLALLDHLAFVDQPFFHAAGDLKGHLGFGGFDVARNADLPFRPLPTGSQKPVRSPAARHKNRRGGYQLQLRVHVTLPV